MTLPTWRDLAPGGVIQEPGNAIEYKTGEWRATKPVVDMAKCTHCLLCWIFCPEGAIETSDGRFIGFDMDHCKGCAICSEECPSKAIIMVPEADSAVGGSR